MLHHLIYKSRARGSMDWQKLLSIMDRSIENNMQAEISGMLFYSGNVFLQVLEGDREAINRIYHQISRDERHGEIQLLGFEPIVSRHFSKWNMRLFHYHDMDDSFKELICRKYGVVDNMVMIPSDPLLAFSLLLDVYTMDQGGA